MKKNKQECGLGHNLGEDNKCLDCGKVLDPAGAHVLKIYPSGKATSCPLEEKKECEHDFEYVHSLSASSHNFWCCEKCGLVTCKNPNEQSL